jgi:hypothetical protein
MNAHFNTRHALPPRGEAARSVPTPLTIAPQSFCATCEAPASESGICPECDTVIDRGLFFAFYPDAPDTDWRPWMTEPVEDAPRVIVWDFTR